MAEAASLKLKEQLGPDHQEVAAEDTHETPQPQERVSSFWDDFDEEMEKVGHLECTSSSQAEIEMINYFSMKVLNRKEDPLKWWRDEAHTFPRLKTCKKFLATPATSVPSELFFESW